MQVNIENKIVRPYGNSNQKKSIKPYRLVINEIEELSLSHEYWKLHILGPITLNTNAGELLVDAWFAPLIRPSLFLNSSEQYKLINNFQYDFSIEKSRRLQLGIGQLPILIPGTIFRNGFPEIRKYPRYLKRTFKITPTEENQKIISSGDTWGQWNGKDRYYIPNDQFQILQHYEPYPAKFLLVEFQDGEKPPVSLDKYPLNHFRWYQEREIFVKNGERKEIEGYGEIDGIIFSCIELARFYMTYSSQSCRELFAGGIVGETNRMFNPEQTVKPDANGNGGFLRLSQFVVDEDWKVLVRAAFDDYALSEFRRVYISLLNNKTKEGLFLPEARFPFRNEMTNLTVHGTYLQSGNRIYFLVSKIANCTAPPPYNPDNVSCDFFRDNPGSKKCQQTEIDVYQDRTEIVEDSNNEIGTVFDDAADDEEILTIRTPEGGKVQSDKPPSRNRKKTKYLMLEDERFEYQKKSPLRERQPKPANIKQGSNKPVKPEFVGSDEDIEIISTAPGDGNDPITPGSISPVVPEPDTLSCGDQSVLKTDDEEKLSKSESHNLPINFNVFEEILIELKKQREEIEANMITIPVKGEYLLKSELTIFPSLLNPNIVNSDTINNSLNRHIDKRRSSLPFELFVAEIKDENGQYAYLMDMEATLTKTGRVSRSFQMYLCFDRKRKRKFATAKLRRVINKCESNGGKWDVDVKEKHDIRDFLDSMFDEKDMVEFSFKHNMNTVEKYATRIIKALTESKWLKDSE